MKSVLTKSLALSLFASFAASSGFAAPLAVVDTAVRPGAVATVTLGFTVSSTLDNEVKVVNGNDVHSGKIEKTSYTTKAFLEDLIAQQYIPGPLKGWKIELVNSSPLEGDGDRAFYAVKAGLDPVRLPESVLRLSGDLPGYANTYTETYDSEGVLISGKTSPFRQQAGLAGSHVTDGAEFSMVGVLSGSDKSGPVNIGSETYFFYYMLNSAKISGMVGSIEDLEDPEAEDLLMEGILSVGPEKAMDISAYATNTAEAVSTDL